MERQRLGSSAEVVGDDDDGHGGRRQPRRVGGAIGYFVEAPIALAGAFRPQEHGVSRCLGLSDVAGRASVLVFLKENVSRYDVIFYFGDGTYLEDRMLAKLRREMRPGAVLLLAHMPEDPGGFEPLSRFGVVRSYRRAAPPGP
jgi:hypothetical protein